MLAAGMLFFALKVANIFGGSKIGRAWFTFTFSAAVLCVISLVALTGALELITLPVWWREGSAIVFRVTLLYALYRFYKAWTTLR